MSQNFLFEPPATPTVAIRGSGSRFPVHRIYCVGRNYAEHAKEMGAPVERERPVFFMKPADAIVTQRRVPYPSGTTNLHHEVELVVALSSGGTDIPAPSAMQHVYGYAVGLDLTRRDLQAEMKKKSLPWDIAKGFDASAPISEIVPALGVHPANGTLALDVNGETRQSADVADMIFPVAEIIAELSKLYELRAGDLIYTGTPSGVAALQRGDRFRATFAELVLEGEIV